MPDRAHATATTAGILRAEEFVRHVSLERRPAGPAAAAWVENHWVLSWDLPRAARVPSQVLAHPTGLIVERGHPRAGVGAERVLVTGVTTGRFDVELQGRGPGASPTGPCRSRLRSAPRWIDRWNREITG